MFLEGIIVENSNNDSVPAHRGNIKVGYTVNGVVIGQVIE